MECRRCGLRCFQPGSLWVHHTCVPAIAPRPCRRLALRPTARAPVLSPWTLVLAPRWCTVCLCFRTTVAATTYECVRTVHSPCSPISALPTWIFDLFFFQISFLAQTTAAARPGLYINWASTVLHSTVLVRTESGGTHKGQSTKALRSADETYVYSTLRDYCTVRFYALQNGVRACVRTLVVVAESRVFKHETKCRTR